MDEIIMDPFRPHEEKEVKEGMNVGGGIAFRSFG